MKMLLLIVVLSLVSPFQFARAENERKKRGCLRAAMALLIVGGATLTVPTIAYWDHINPDEKGKSVKVDRPKVTPKETDPDIVKIFRELKFENFKLASAVKLPFDTYHTQGIKKVKDTFYLSTVNGNSITARFGRGEGYLIAFTIDEEEGTATQTKKKKLHPTEDTDDEDPHFIHPGGLDFDANHLWLPLAEYDPEGPTKIIKIDPVTLDHEEMYLVDDHIGQLACDTDGNCLRLGNWGNKGIYRLPLGDKKPIPKDELITGFPKLVNPADPKDRIEYQDWKYLGGEYYMASGLTARGKKGVLDVIKFDIQSAKEVEDGDKVKRKVDSFAIAHRIELPKVTPSGEENERGYALSYNPMDVELIEKDGKKGLRFYFAPYDGPRTHLLTYEAFPEASDDE